MVVFPTITSKNQTYVPGAEIQVCSEIYPSLAANGYLGEFRIQHDVGPCHNNVSCESSLLGIWGSCCACASVCGSFLPRCRTGGSLLSPSLCRMTAFLPQCWKFVSPDQHRISVSSPCACNISWTWRLRQRADPDFEQPSAMRSIMASRLSLRLEFFLEFRLLL